MRFDACFFDLDGTLYDNECGMLQVINERIAQWMRMTMDLPENELLELREHLFTEYGGTLPGLAEEYGSDYYASMRYCHDLPVEEFVQPNSTLREALLQIPCRKYVFTSSYRFYAVRVLRVLGILDCFDGIIDALDVYPRAKPNRSAFQKAFEMTAEDDIRRCAFLDDHARNISAAHQLGFFTVQVGNETRSEEADAWIAKIEDILTIPEFSAGMSRE